MVDALLRLADAEVATKKGISGTMLKTAYSGAKKASAGSVRQGIDRLLPGIARALDPHFEAKGDLAFGTYLADPARSGQVADELLAVADSAAARASRATPSALSTPPSAARARSTASPPCRAWARRSRGRALSTPCG